MLEAFLDCLGEIVWGVFYEVTVESWIRRNWRDWEAQRIRRIRMMRRMDQLQAR